MNKSKLGRKPGSSKAQIEPPVTPECDRLSKVEKTGHNRQISEFLETLQALVGALGSTDRTYIKKVDIDSVLKMLDSFDGAWTHLVIQKFWAWLVKTKTSEGEWYTVYDIRIYDVLHEYFGIDPQKVETERRELLAMCRGSNALTKAREELGLGLGEEV